MMGFRKIFVAAACSASLLAAAAPAMAGDATVGNLMISKAWARATAGAGVNGAAFLSIANHGAADRLVAAEAPVAGTCELHTHLMDGGVMQMRQVPGIDIPQHADVVLQPGGLHVMLMGLKGPLKQGESFPLTLTFAQAGKVTVSVDVGTVGQMPDHGGGHKMH